jgi:hypothetical protein
MPGKQLFKVQLKTLPLELLAQLEPGFVNGLYTYEGNKNSGKMPMDWQAWTDLPTDPETLARMDVYTEYRNKLDDSHFDQLVKMQREAKKQLSGQEYDAGLFAGMRTRSQIVQDLFSQQGWSDKSSSGREAMAEFNRALDFRIAGEQEAKGKQLSPLEIQDIADKLLIEDRNTTFGMGGQGQAMGVENPDEFIAAREWEEVQAR